MACCGHSFSWPFSVATELAEYVKNNYSLVQYYDNYYDNVKSGLINPAGLINPHCPMFFCNLKTGGPPGLMNSLPGPD